MAVASGLGSLTDAELSAETTSVIENRTDLQKEQLLQHRIMQIQMDTQNLGVDPTILMTIDLVPEPPKPDINGLPLALQQYVLEIARGLQSSDPRAGLYTMLASVGIDRNAVNVQIAGEQFSLGILNFSFSGMVNELSQYRTLLNNDRR